MTLPANSRPFSEALPSENEQQLAKQLLSLFAAQRKGDIVLRAHPSDDTEAKIVSLNPSLSDALMELLRFVSEGDAVTLVPINKQLTTQQAADVLNVSRPYLIKMLEVGEIEFTTIGRHRRVQAKDVFKYKEGMARQRDEALSSLAETDSALL